MPFKLLLLAAMATAQAGEEAAMLTCLPDSLEVTNEGSASAWSCAERRTSCDPRSYDPAGFERRGAELVQAFASREDGVTIESVTRILADGRFEEVVEWRDANGETSFREVTRGRCERDSERG